jgi:hypothetical protein
MRRTLLILPLLIAACATPREQCINDVTRDLRTISGLVNETQANITRGFAIAETQELRTIRTNCTGTNADGSTFTFPCEETETISREVPVAIDLNAERAKLESLLERQAQLQRAADPAVQQCIAIHPE